MREKPGPEQFSFSTPLHTSHAFVVGGSAYFFATALARSARASFRLNRASSITPASRYVPRFDQGQEKGRQGQRSARCDRTGTRGQGHEGKRTGRTGVGREVGGPLDEGRVLGGSRGHLVELGTINQTGMGQSEKKRAIRSARPAHSGDSVPVWEGVWDVP